MIRGILTASHAVEAEAVARAIALANSEAIRLERAMLRLGLADEESLLRASCAADGVPFADDLLQFRVDPARVGELTLAYLETRQIAPVMDGNNTPHFLMSDPADDSLVAELEFHFGTKISRYGATSAAVRQLLTAARLSEADSAQSQLLRDQSRLRSSDADGPVIRYVQETLTDAVLAGASDVHFESCESGLDIRFRINGSLVARNADTNIATGSVFARLKVMAEANVAERRLPQDGRFSVVLAGRTVDFRFSSLPTHLGESVVCRVLDPRALRLGWDKLGFPKGIAENVRKTIERPSGLFLVTGPTGSGKTTTLYTALAHLNTIGRKIITVEDPVEYSIPGLQQVQVHEAIGLSFARVLRGILRHDPNVILVGEIRDEETAEIACRAAQVGRMVLSTLHTNSAEGAVTRLKDLGVPDFIVKDVLRGVLAQSLVPVRCGACAGDGCKACEQTGFSGRTLKAELLTLS